MTNVELSGLMAAHRKNRRAQVERQLHMSNEIATKSWTKEDKAGKCYVYRGVKYCY